MDSKLRDDFERQAADCPVRGRIQLVIGVSIGACLWLVVLPRVAQIPRVGEYLNRLEEKKIDASAMFYTELEAMEPILNRSNEKKSTGKERSPTQRQSGCRVNRSDVTRLPICCEAAIPSVSRY